MNQIEIQIIRLQIFQCFCKGCFGMFIPRILNPDLRAKKQLFPWNSTAFHCISYSTLISVTGCCINQSVACLQCSFYTLLTKTLICDLKYTESKQRHGNAIVKLNGLHIISSLLKLLIDLKSEIIQLIQLCFLFVNFLQCFFSLLIQHLQPL